MSYLEFTMVLYLVISYACSETNFRKRPIQSSSIFILHVTSLNSFLLSKEVYLSSAV